MKKLFTSSLGAAVQNSWSVHIYVTNCTTVHNSCLFCFVRMPHSIKKKTKTTWDKLSTSSCQFNIGAAVQNSWSVHIYVTNCTTVLNSCVVHLYTPKVLARIYILKHGKENSISCFLWMPHSIINKTKTTCEKVVNK